MRTWWRNLWHPEPSTDDRVVAHNFAGMVWYSQVAKTAVLIRPDLLAPFKAKIAERGDFAPDVIARAIEEYIADEEQ